MRFAIPVLKYSEFKNLTLLNPVKTENTATIDWSQLKQCGVYWYLLFGEREIIFIRLMLEFQFIEEENIDNIGKCTFHRQDFSGNTFP